MHGRHMNKRKGFTLIELIVAVTIVGILAAIAIPSYREYVIRGHRRAAQAAMMDIATQQQQFFVANRAYAGSVNDLGYVLPTEVAQNYTAAVVADAGPPPGFTITFTPQGGQTSDGNLTLNSNGVKGPAGKW
jgi:type IV pilus assembly protein PilE